MVFNFTCFRTKKGHVNKIYFDSAGLESLKEDKTMRLYPLYPYHAIELYVSFVYGEDIPRHHNISITPKTVQILIILIMVLMIITAIILYVMRRRLVLRRNDFISSIIDTLIAFIAGGNLRMQHTFERQIFAIVLFAAFFITSLFSGNLLDYTIQSMNQKISTFEQLAKINSTIYTSQKLSAYDDDIHEMLR